MSKLKCFIALDSESNNKNIVIVKKLKNYVYGFKVGYRSFYKDDNKKLITEIKKSSNLFLDLKLNDIPNTVAQGLESLKRIKPDYLSLHLSGGERMLSTAKNYLKKNKINTKILGITVLTSLDNKDIKQMYGNMTVNKLLINFSKLAIKSKIDGLVCSGQDLKILNKYQNLLKITPGIKLFHRKADDQKRTISAEDAFKNGADYIVIGREIINHTNPINALQSFYEENKNKNMWTA
ncbi:MAG: orotidine-5'-phosphate decarboxylase [Pelagibacteraceae bacterium]|nr:orotidine-5'-phosphate decarboxylase [Pelagibacteraceae bacterium]|tara:strand:+ start:50 stop:757 length:708 start_codon:yes stop_codon:yes gene_type:complete